MIAMEGEDVRWQSEGDGVLRQLLRRDLSNERFDQAMVLSDPRISSLLEEVRRWPWAPITSHKSAGHPLHKLAFLADLGVDLGVAAPELLETMRSFMTDGLPRLPNRTPVHYGGSGEVEMAWSLCDAPLLLRSLAVLYPSFDVSKGLRSLMDMVRDNGMPCRVSPELGRFRGPGRKEDPCPLANLYTLRAIMTIDPRGYEAHARMISEVLLSLWRDSWERHPYMFYMGTDFRKLKLPFVWYDIMSVADTLSNCPWVRQDPRFRDMLSIIASKPDENGWYTPESIWTSWKGWDFAQKKEPSRWLTFYVERLQRRAKGV